MKPGDLVEILPRPFLENRKAIGMILECLYYDEDPVDLIPVKIVAQGRITYVSKEYIKPLKRSTHVSKNKN
jgi:hypothetical protein